VDVADLTLVPYPKPLTIKTGGQQGFADLRPPPGSAAERFTQSVWHVPPDRVRPGALADSAARPAVVVSPKYVAGAATSMEPVSRAEMMVILGTNSSNISAHGDRVLDVLETVARRTANYRLVFGNVGSAADAVLGLLQGLS
jgi:hypothetical protein